MNFFHDASTTWFCADLLATLEDGQKRPAESARTAIGMLGAFLNASAYLDTKNGQRTGHPLTRVHPIYARITLTSNEHVFLGRRSDGTRLSPVGADFNLAIGNFYRIIIQGVNPMLAQRNDL